MTVGSYQCPRENSPSVSRRPPVSISAPAALAASHHALDLVEFAAGEFRADIDQRCRIADLQRLHRLGEALEELVGDLLVDIHALVADADLAAILEARHHRGAHRRADIGILGHDEGRLAAEFEAQAP